MPDEAERSLVINNEIPTGLTDSRGSFGPACEQGLISVDINTKRRTRGKERTEC